MKILAIDDSQFFQEVIKNDLAIGNYEVQAVTNGEEAIEILMQTPFDLVIIDLELPGLSGFDICESIKSNNDNPNFKTPCIFFTSSDSLKDRDKGFQLGAVDFLNKKFEKGELLLRVNKILKPTRRFEGLTAVVIDDSVISLRITQHILEKEGLKVITAADGLEGLDLIKRIHHEIDLVITDHEMPNLDGVEMTKEIRKDPELKDIPIIIVTATNDREKTVSLFNAGANDYIVKPYIKEEFVSRVYSHLESYTLKKILKGNVKKLIELNTLKDEFLKICSHDLRAPLNSMMGFADLLLDTKLNDEQRDHVNCINESGEILLHLITDLLNLRKIGLDEPIELKELAPEKLVTKSVSTMKGLALIKKIDFDYSMEIDPDYLIYGDEVALVRSLNNIISNSIKFTPSGKSVRVNAYNDDENIIFAIQDTGVGIKEEMLKELRAPKEHNSTLGTKGEVGFGLGVKIVQDIISKHDGTFLIGSKGEGLGTTVAIKIPIKKG